MFTLTQIKDAHSKVQSGKDFPAYIKALAALGISHYTTYVEDGHTQYIGIDHQEVSSSGIYEKMVIADQGDHAHFTQRLKAHQAGMTDYLTFCKDCAETGVHHWLVSMSTMTCTYYDTHGNEILQEMIPS